MLSGGEKFFAHTVKVLSDEGLGKNKLLKGGAKNIRLSEGVQGEVMLSIKNTIISIRCLRQAQEPIS